MRILKQERIHVFFLNYLSNWSTKLVSMRVFKAQPEGKANLEFKAFCC